MSAPYDRPASEPGGMECCECGAIFVGAEWHDQCAVCANNGWLPIETGPKDGTEVLGFWSFLYPNEEEPTTGMDVINWQTHLFPDSDAAGWVDRDGLCNDGVFTHWRSLPKPPESAS